MSLKLVLISPSGTLEKDNKLHGDVIKSVAQLVADLAKQNVKVAIWSNRLIKVNRQNGQQPLHEFLSELAGTPVEYVGLQVGMPARQRANSVAPILQRFGVKIEETILVGAREEDMRAGVNNKLLLLRPSWYQTDLEYGFEVASITELRRFCMLFGTREHPIFWRINDINHGLMVNALGPFSTMIQAYAAFGEDAKNAAKYEAGTLKFWHQLVTSTLYFSGIMHKVDYITVYPGHASGTRVKAFHEVLDLLGKCFHKPFLPNLLVRHTDAAKSSLRKAGEREFRTQLNTIKIDSRASKLGAAPRKSALDLRGKNVLVVDDICTSGRSLEVARTYLGAAQASCILFAWLKTINTDYLRISEAIPLRPFEANVINNEPRAIAYPYRAQIVDTQAPTELDELLRRYQAWEA